MENPKTGFSADEEQLRGLSLKQEPKGLLIPSSPVETLEQLTGEKVECRADTLQHTSPTVWVEAEGLKSLSCWIGSTNLRNINQCPSPTQQLLRITKCGGVSVNQNNLERLEFFIKLLNIFISHPWVAIGVKVTLTIVGFYWNHSLNPVICWRIHGFNVDC